MYTPIAIILFGVVFLGVLICGRRDARAWVALLAMFIIPVVIMAIAIAVAFSSIGAPISGDRILSTIFTLLPAFGAAVGFASLYFWPRQKERFSLRSWIPAAVLLLLLTAAVVPSVVFDSGIELSWFFEVRSGSRLSSTIQSSDRAVDVLVGCVLLLVLAAVVSQARSVTRPLAYGSAAVFAGVTASLVLFAANAAEGVTQIDFGYTEAEMADIPNFIHIANVGYGVGITFVVVAMLLTFLATRAVFRARR